MTDKEPTKEQIRPAIKEMPTLDLVILRHKVISSQDKSDQDFRNEIDEELKLRQSGR